VAEQLLIVAKAARLTKTVNTQSEFRYRSLLQVELQEVEARLLETPANAPPEVTLALREVIASGGKRLRPVLTLLSAHLCSAPLARVIPVAAGIELLHTATLIHDDLIDNATVRRGHPTLNAHWSTPATVLAGDWVFARAAALAAQGQNLKIVERFSATLGTICAGELSQFFSRRGQTPTYEDYERRIFAKTASLFALAMEVGPQIAGSAPEDVAALSRFGVLLGSAFQITDDILDFVGDEATLGKPVGSDLQQGLVTLPVLEYLKLHPEDDRVREILHTPGDTDMLQTFVADLRASGAIASAMSVAEGHIQTALALLDDFPPSPYRQAIEEIAAFAIRRPY